MRASIENQRLIEEASMVAFLRLVGSSSAQSDKMGAPPIEALVKFVTFICRNAPQTRISGMRETPEETALKGTCFDDSADGNDEPEQPPLDGASVLLSFHGRFAVSLLSYS